MTETFWIIKWKDETKYTVACKIEDEMGTEWMALGSDWCISNEEVLRDAEVIKEIDLNEIVNEIDLTKTRLHIMAENQVKNGILQYECKGECYNVPIGFFERCLWCKVKWMCEDDCGFLADRDSDHCRMVHYHYIEAKNYRPLVKP